MSIQNRAVLRLVFNTGDERGNHIMVGSFTNALFSVFASRKLQDEQARRLAALLIDSEKKALVGYVLDANNCEFVRIPNAKIHSIPSKKIR